MINRLSILLAPLFGLASVAFAGIGPISYNDTGLGVTVATVGPDVWLTGITGKDSNGNTLSEAGSSWPGTVNGDSTWLYCVDDQRTVNVPGTYTANVILLSNIAADASSVSLGNSSDWTNSLGGANTAAARYEMAAYLVSNFSYAADGSLTGAGADVAKNQSIQSAIWALTNNSDFGSSGISHVTDGTGPDAGLAANSFWVSQAEANYQTVDQNHWAVISFTDGSGNLAGIQTLLVEVTPEPGFYGLVMTLGLGALLFASRRHRAQQ